MTRRSEAQPQNHDQEAVLAHSVNIMMDGLTERDVMRATLDNISENSTRSLKALKLRGLDPEVHDSIKFQEGKLAAVDEVNSALEGLYKLREEQNKQK